jgi:hypothetical protein
MSYSFNIRAADKASAKEAVKDAFDGVVASQPIHARDRDAALANANAAIDLIVDDPSCDVVVGLSGYVGWRELLDAECSNPLTSASVSASASLVSKVAAPIPASAEVPI